MTTLPHTHETGECLACDLEMVGVMRQACAAYRLQAHGCTEDIARVNDNDAAVIARISTALATSRELERDAEETAALRDLAHRLSTENIRNRTELAASQARIAELEADREHLETAAGVLMLAMEKHGIRGPKAEAWLIAERERRAKR